MLQNTGKNLPDGDEHSDADYTALIALALRQELDMSSYSIKTLMRCTGAGERTVKNWLSGVRGPSGPHLLALVRRFDAVHDAFLLLTGRPPLGDEEVGTAVRFLREALRLLERN